MELTSTQKQALYEQGYVALPGIVPQELVEKALHAINASLGSEGMDPQRLPILRAQTYCPEITASPEITNLLTESPLWSLSESVIGQGSILPVKSGQIALRFPAPGPARLPRPHLDGMYSPNNGVKEGAIDNFTALIGVFLSAIPHDFMGNLAVWPGTHRLFEDYFRKHTPQSLLKGLPEVNLPELQQITAQPGDAVLCHYQLGHGITINTSPYIRYAIFFRLRHVNHEQWQWECMTNIWREWAGMHDFVNSRVG
ncbi:phytanoyl-CoA dioxygenase family protein [Ktedonobacter racemifer]|uniref:Phytanoyl-CoA dioxygenase n=1 Tax=Ktedonobacter racemifer DSM 44963 TaxID=485913 RepID=D6TTT8_KTERA|nr:hypothetical protein [Ktedonobacter racemifer]EFH83839.1 phytanoyl-CoA dioxygenase [Ktedonobacter racemifer DSM 44963]